MHRACSLWVLAACASPPASPPFEDGQVLLALPNHDFEAWLTTPDGDVLHRWSVDPEDYGVSGKRGTFRRAWLQPDGALLALIEYSSLWMLERDGGVRWHVAHGNHHDVLSDGEGGWWSLVEERSLGRTVDRVVHYDADGRRREAIDLQEALARSPGQEALAEAVAATEHDPLHINTITRVPAGAPAPFEEGHWLLSSRTQNTLLLFDPDEEQVTWSSTGPFEAQHDPRFLGPDRLLLLDNGTPRAGTQIIELGLPDLDLQWSSQRLPHTSCCGTVQRVGDLTWGVLTMRGVAVAVGPEGFLRHTWAPGIGASRLYQAEQIPRPDWLSGDPD